MRMWSHTNQLWHFDTAQMLDSIHKTNQKLFFIFLTFLAFQLCQHSVLATTFVDVSLKNSCPIAKAKRKLKFWLAKIERCNVFSTWHREKSNKGKPSQNFLSIFEIISLLFDSVSNWTIVSVRHCFFSAVLFCHNGIEVICKHFCCQHFPLHFSFWQSKVDSIILHTIFALVHCVGVAHWDVLCVRVFHSFLPHDRNRIMCFTSSTYRFTNHSRPDLLSKNVLLLVSLIVARRLCLEINHGKLYTLPAWFTRKILTVICPYAACRGFTGDSDGRRLKVSLSVASKDPACTPCVTMVSNRFTLCFCDIY